MSTGENDKQAPDGDEQFVRSVLEKGLLSQSQIEQCREAKKKLMKSGQERSLAGIAAEKTFLSQTQADQIDREALPTHVPKVAGNYEIVRQIGEGGMGTVYKGRHTKLGSYAAVKFLPARLAQDPNFVQRFEREARLAAQLTSPFSVRTFDVGESEGTRCIYMEYVEGESLDELLRREKQFDEKRALTIIRDVASALEEAHELGIIHRDIKPANILLSRRGTPKVADLGLAKDVEKGGQGSLTSYGAILGTPSYMSPEQAMGLPDLDARSDIYSLGASLYRMVVGDVPFRGETPVNVMHKIATDPLMAPLERNPKLSRETGALICKMMAKDRKDRYQSMAEVRAGIEAILSGEQTGLEYEQSVVLLHPEERIRPAKAPSRPGPPKTKLAIGVGAGILALVVVAFFVFRSSGTAPKPAKPPAEPEPTVAAPPTTAPGTTPVETPVMPADATAVTLMAEANEAVRNARWEQARALAEKVREQFPKSPEAAQAATLIQTAQREMAIQELMTLAGTGEPIEAVARIDDARRQWPNENRLAELRRTAEGRFEKAYGDAMAQGTVAEKRQDFAGAVGAYERALKYRDTDDARDKLKSAQLREQLVDAGQSKDAIARLLAVADTLEKSRDESAKNVRAETRELVDARTRARAAMDHARLFHDDMGSAAKADFALADEKLSRGEEALNQLSPVAVTADAQHRIAVDFREAEVRLDKAALTTFDELYPGIDEQMRGPDYAAGLLRLHEAKSRFSAYPGLKRLVAEYDPDGDGEDIIALVAATRAQASDYDSPEEAAEACAKLDDACGRCETFKSDTDTGRKAASMKILVLARRAAARDAAGNPLEALADAASAAHMVGDGEPFGDLLSSAAAHAVRKLGEELTAGHAPEFVGKAGALLDGEMCSAARWSLGEAIRKAPFLRDFMRDTGLVGAWSKTIARFEPHGMVTVPAGTYPLGLKYEGLVTLTPNNSPEQPVRLGEFFIDAKEVTNEDFKRFVDDGGYSDDRWWGDVNGDRKTFVDATGKPGPKNWRECRFPAGRDKMPVVGVSCMEAAAYARWAGKRLPTEAEWECAALGVPPRPGQDTFGKRPFPWGDEYVKDAANLQESDVGRAEAVGSRKMDVSAVECFDMVGNVREWTSGLYDPYPGSKCKDKNFGKGFIVVRGASFADTFIGASPLMRRPIDKIARDERIGFRCAWSIEPGQDKQ